jgi:signal transduction histidine kinase
LRDASSVAGGVLLIVDDGSSHLAPLVAALDGLDVRVVVSPDGRELTQAPLAVLIDADAPALAELERRWPDVPQLLAVSTPRLYERAAVVLWRPIAPAQLRHPVERLLEQAEARALLRFHEQLVAHVAHDLGSPLNVITLAAESLSSVSQDPEVLKLVGHLGRSGALIRRLIAEMLDVVRARHARGVSLERRPMDLVPVVRRALDVAAARYPTRALVLTPGVPELRGAWDPIRVEQLLGVMVGLALELGTPEVPVRLTLAAEGAEVVVTVVHGGELPDGVQVSLRSPFSARDVRRGKREGLGLGLYLAAQIAHGHGGTLTADSDAGTTTLTLRLPHTRGLSGRDHPTVG